MTYYIIISGAGRPDFMKYQNPIFKQLSQFLQINKPMKFKSELIDQGTNIGLVACGGGSVIVLCNRSIDFEQDIKYHSRLMKNDLNKSIDSYVKMKDKIGEAE